MSFAERIAELYKPTADTIEVSVKADCLAVELLLKALDVPYAIQRHERHNAEHMSVSGELPILKVENEILEGFQSIRAFFKSQGHCLCDKAHLDESQQSEVEAYMSLIRNTIQTAEMYMTWTNHANKQMMKKLCGRFYPLPLNYVVPWLKGRLAAEQLRARGWIDRSQHEVCDEVSRVCCGLQAKLGSQKYFFGNSVTEVDMLLCGHVRALSTEDRLPDVFLLPVVQTYRQLLTLTDTIGNSEHEY
ncbi:metaxin-2-like isoform X2 [Corticium candelabrum]|uniref:metaxin-2-like isoform X2 n=1 Tax=Corticium candelabrum TaxID=121492 RepID=UPI002E2750C4|nr:metaxin-2-like isoform X2 [Corticium candelabrum]